MKLLVDAGNSCLKWAWLDDNTLRDGGRVVRGKKTAKAVLAEAWDETEETPEAVVVANVAGDAFRRSLTTYIKKRWGLKPDYLVAESSQCGVTNSYSKPNTLGVDRWLAMLGARAIKSAPLCVIDCGTAMTIDVVDRNGQHKGGLIMPGMHLMRQSLVDAASAIKEPPTLSDAVPGSFLATDTGNAIIVGTLYTAISALDRIIADVRAEFGPPLQCYITGGEAELFLPLIDNRIRHVPDLVFKGMQAILRESQPSEEGRPDETTQAGDETSSSEASKPRKKTRPRKKSRAKKENRPDEQGQTGEASEASKPDEVNTQSEESQTPEEARPGEESKPDAASQANDERPVEESDTNEADKPAKEKDKAREQAL